MSYLSIRKFFAASALLAMLLAGSAHAELKVGLVDFQRLVQESPQGKAASQLLQNEFSPKIRELQQKQKDLQAKAEKLNKDAAIMSEKEVAALKKEITNGQTDLQRDGESFNEEQNAREGEEIGKLQNLLVNEISGFAKEGGYDLIIPANVALYAKESFNVTAQVLSYLQTRPLVAAPVNASKPVSVSPKPASSGAKPSGK